MTRTGRPVKSDEGRKDDIIRVRVTAEQKAAFTAAATRAGHDVSTWLRALGVAEVARSAKSQASASEPSYPLFGVDMSIRELAVVSGRPVDEIRARLQNSETTESACFGKRDSDGRVDDRRGK